MKDPVKIHVETKKKAQELGSKRRLVEKEDDLVYVPIQQTLQALLTNETEVKFNVCSYNYEICVMLERGHRHTSSGALSDYCNGSYFKSHPMFASYSNAKMILKCATALDHILRSTSYQC